VWLKWWIACLAQDPEFKPQYHRRRKRRRRRRKKKNKKK
jgi:hypothetical protein